MDTGARAFRAVRAVRVLTRVHRVVEVPSGRSPLIGSVSLYCSKGSDDNSAIFQAKNE